MTLERLLGRMIERAETEVGQVAPFEPCSTFNQTFGPCVDSEPESSASSAAPFMRGATRTSHSSVYVHGTYRSNARPRSHCGKPEGFQKALPVTVTQSDPLSS